ncbi:MAG: phosphotransferase [Hyellaceae cyanobacterium CSU_1_1]|nr:phosphotransferase [Hyellaceae cyanobacterium CSU_1_1]
MVAMDVFPAIYSTLSPQALIEGVLTEYELGTINQCLFWHRGLSDIYLIETKRKSYILKISHHHWRSQSDIQFELEFLDFLDQHNLPIASPLKTKSEQLCVTINAVEGDRYAALFPYAPGEIPQGDLNLEQSMIMGQALGKLHETSLQFKNETPRQCLNLKYLLDDSLETINPYLRNHTQDRSYLLAVIEEIKQQLTCLDKTAPLWSVCWGDPHSGNVHFTTDNQITLFDFDQCGYGWRVFDLAKFLQVSLSAGINRKVRDAFFKGYEDVQQLTDAEVNSLQALTQVAHIWAWAISIKASAVHNWARIDDFYVNRRLNHLKRLSSQDWQLF